MIGSFGIRVGIYGIMVSLVVAFVVILQKNDEDGRKYALF